LFQSLAASWLEQSLTAMKAEEKDRNGNSRNSMVRSFSSFPVPAFSHLNESQGILTKGGSKVDLIKAASIVKKVNNMFNIKRS
jgi:hypothetical protein